MLRHPGPIYLEGVGYLLLRGPHHFVRRIKRLFIEESIDPPGDVMRPVFHF